MIFPNLPLDKSHFITELRYGEYKTSKRSNIAKTVRLAPPVLINTESKKAGRVTVYWENDPAVKGFQIRYSTEKDMSGSETITIRRNNVTERTVTGLTSKKYYYFQIRSYKKVDEKNYYSTWCGRQKVRIR